MRTTSGETVRRRASVGRGGDYERLLLTKELEWLRTLTHVAPVGIFRADQYGKCVYVNERWTEISGISANTMLGSSWERPVHPDDVEAIKTEWERSLEARQSFRMEHRYVHRNGRIVWVLSQVVREVDGRGQAVGYTGMTTDISELRQIREELQRSHHALEVRMRSRSAELHRMARIVESIDDAVVSCDLEGRVLTWNHAAETIFGYRALEMVGQSIFILAPDAVQEQARGAEKMIREGGEVHRMETMAVSKAGQLFDLALSGFPLRDDHGTIIGTWAIMRDITDRKSAERRLQRLSWRLLKVQDDERRRIARDLHDSTAQALAALSMNLSVLARENSPLSDDRRNQLLRDSQTLADQATTELRTTSYLLHPPLLDERGLRSALGWLSDGFAQRSGVKVAVEVSAEVERMANEVETALFRVAQEGLLNVHRHSGSSRAELRLAKEGDEVRLEIRDWGKGFFPNSADQMGVGIVSMRERLLQLGGSLEIEAAEPGTRVIARVHLT